MVPTMRAVTERTLFDRVGGAAFFERLVDRFYAGVEADDVLLAVYPDHADLAGARHRLTLFLVQYWGGPPTYNEERGHPRLRMRHAPFAIGSLERDRWLVHMRAAIDAVERARRRARRAPRLHDDGRRRDAQSRGHAQRPARIGRRAPVAQWIERSRPKAGVGGSNPSGGAIPTQLPRRTGEQAGSTRCRAKRSLATAALTVLTATTRSVDELDVRRGRARTPGAGRQSP